MPAIDTGIAFLIINHDADNTYFTILLINNKM